MKKIFISILFIILSSPCFASMTWTSSNLISGAEGNGNVVANTQYMRHDEYACADSAWTLNSQTCENVLFFQTTGADDQLLAGNTSPAGDIIVRTYTKSTSTMSSSPITVWDDATYYTSGLLPQRNANENFIRLYFPYFKRSDASFVGIYLIKSTDLTATSWGSPIPVATGVTGGVNGIFSGFLDTNLSSTKIMVFINSVGNQVILSTTDGGDTFNTTPYSTNLNTSSNNEEGRCVKEFNGSRIICIERSNSGDYLLQTNSPDYGKTWTALSSTGLGAATGQKVQAVLSLSSGKFGRVTAYFYDRGDSRLKISGPTLFDNAYKGNWIQTYLIGTGQDGNGGFTVLDYSNNSYLISNSSTVEPNNSLHWWTGKDKYMSTRF